MAIYLYINVLKDITQKNTNILVCRFSYFQTYFKVKENTSSIEKMRKAQYKKR